MVTSNHTRISLLLFSLLVSILLLWMSTSFLTASSTSHPNFAKNGDRSVTLTFGEGHQGNGLYYAKLIETAVSPTNTLPVSFSKKITTGVPSSIEQFGTVLAMDGDMLAVSAYATDTVYVYERNHGGISNWGEVARLTAGDAQNDVWEWFGIPTAFSGSYLVVGAPFATVDGKTFHGAVYIFERTNNQGTIQWSEIAKLTASDGQANDGFGFSLDIDKETIVVGIEEYSQNPGPGKAYIFQQQPGTNNWLETTILTATNGYGGDGFGSDVAISDQTIVIGARVDQQAYLFRFNENLNQWDEVSTLIPSHLLGGINFGGTVEIEDTIVLVSQSGAEINGNTAQGAVYVFEQSATNPDLWLHVATLIAADGTAQADFGIDIALANKTALIGARGDNAAYLFHQNAGDAHQWEQTNKITSPDNAGEFGLGVAMITDTIAIGDRWVRSNNNEEFGAAYIYSLTTTFPLAIQFEGTGSGQIMGNLPSAICSDDCVELIEYGTAVTLTAVTDTHSTFTGWSGSCSGETLTCQLIIQTDTVVTAHFDSIEYKLYFPIVVR